MSREGAVFFLFYFPHCIFDLFYFVSIDQIWGSIFYAIPELNCALGFVFSVTLCTR
jgi:hypothetical protein